MTAMAVLSRTTIDDDRFSRLRSLDLLSADEWQELRTTHMIELRVEDHRTRRN